MHSRIGISWALMGVLTLGCSSYRYMRDLTPELEVSRREYVLNNPGNRFNDDIRDGRVRSGMSRLQVRITWGDPDRIDAGLSPRIGEVWSYEESETSRSTTYRLHFDGERLARMEMVRGAVPLPSAETDRRAKKRAEEGLQPATDTRKPGDLR